MLLAELIKADMKPALGVTEPAAIALACAKARALTSEEPLFVEVQTNSGIYKNAFTCGIPNTDKVGNDFAAALGAWFGDPNKELMVLDGITEQQVECCGRKIAEGKVKVSISSISPDIMIRALVTTEHDACEAIIKGTHTNVCYLRRNKTVLTDENRENEKSETIVGRKAGIEEFTLKDFYDFSCNASADDISFINQAFEMNGALSKAACESPRCTFTQQMLQWPAEPDKQTDVEKQAIFLAASAAEARVLGLNYPAMSITGSGNHGIISTMPLLAVAQAEHISLERLLQATALSYLVTMYIKHYSGVLSALCGCAVAAGTGMACGITFLKGGDYEAICRTLYNMTNSIVGMICQGGNHGCVMKVISAVKTGMAASEFGLAGVQIEACHGIAAETPEQTMRNIGAIAAPGMVETEKIIVGLMEQKAGDLE